MSYAWTKRPSHLAMNIQTLIPKTEQPSTEWFISLQVTDEKVTGSFWWRWHLTNMQNEKGQPHEFQWTPPQSSEESRVTTSFLLVRAALLNAFLVSDRRHQARNSWLFRWFLLGACEWWGRVQLGCEFLTNVKVHLAMPWLREAVWYSEKQALKAWLRKETSRQSNAVKG